MVCTFCGSENRAENRFCGMCGVRLERRNAERRTEQKGATKCSSCGHVNESGYKFCGMCGTKVERRVQERRVANDLSRANAMANAQLPTPEQSRRPQAALPREPEIPPAPEVPANATSVPPRNRNHSGSVYVNPDQITHSTSIGGPSFLGLNSEPLSEGEYLLEDESSSRGGLRTLVLLAILAAILGLIFVQWRSSYRANPKGPVTLQPAASQPQGSTQPPAGKTAPANAAHSSVDSNVASAAAPEPGTQKREESKTAENPTGNQSKGTLTPEAKATLDKEEDSADAKPSAGTDARVPPPEKQKPSAALIKAQQYLQGRGVPQSCEQGLMYLKAATEENDPRAAVQMGALYSSGHCVQQDRVKAYKWFSTAHDLEPGNAWIEKNLNQLWAQMSSDERRQAQN